MVQRTLLSSALLWASLQSLGCGDPEIVVPDMLTVVAVFPSHGSIQVATDVEALIYFSHHVAAGTDMQAKVTLECRGTPPCSAPTASGCTASEIAVDVTYDSGTKVAHVAPASVLQTDTCFTIVVADGIESADANIAPLPAEVRSSFRTR